MAGVFSFPSDGPDLPEEFPRYRDSVVPVELCCNLFNGISFALFSIVIAIEDVRSDLAEIGRSYQGDPCLSVHSPELSFEPVGLAPELAEKGEVVDLSLVEGLNNAMLYICK
jgi:hypothetical protein